MLRRRLRAKRAIGAAAAALVVPGQTVVTGVSRAISPGRVSGPWDLFTRADPDAGDVVIGLTGG